MLKQCRRSLLLILVLVIIFEITLPQPAFASVPIHLDISQLTRQIYQRYPNKRLIADAKRFLRTTPKAFCQAYFDSLAGIDNPTWQAIEEGMAATSTIVGAVTSASSAGAGVLSGYAGMASAVSQMGLGGATTTIAGLMGSNVTGAAATSVVTSAVGGPVVMGAILIGGSGLAAFGTYELGKFTLRETDALVTEICFSKR